MNVNYFRPSYIVEVEAEVTALVHRFDMMVFDPQDGGMDDDEYQKELLIEGWREGNEFAFSTFLKNPNQRGGLLSMPAAELVNLDMEPATAIVASPLRQFEVRAPHLLRPARPWSCECRGMAGWYSLSHSSPSSA